MDPAPQAAACNGSGQPHVLVVPFPAQGHLPPLLDLVALLAARGIPVTVAVTAGNAPLLDPLARAFPSVGTLVLPFPSSPLLPAGCGENTKDNPGHLLRPLMASLARLRAPLLAWCKARRVSRPVTAVVSDLFAGWTQPLAAELGVPRVVFVPTSALYLAMTQSLWLRVPTRRRPGDDNDDERLAFPEIPGAPSFPWRHQSSLFRKHVAGDEVSDAIRQLFLWNHDCDCFAVNTFAALESGYLQACGRRALAVGPLSEATAGVFSNADRGGKPSVPAAEVSAWLDARGDGSVVYVSFGTQHAMPPAQAARVAGALALRSAAFVWAVRSGTAVPEGFEAAAAPRGVVIRGWAPQVEVLRHRAVGWFLTHCGWNSALEAAAAGVAMLAWPIEADQFTNAWLLAEAGVALPVAEGADALPDARRLASAIDAALGEEGKPVREPAMELARKAAAAVAAGGSSRGDTEELVRMLSAVA